MNDPNYTGPEPCRGGSRGGYDPDNYLGRQPDETSGAARYYRLTRAEMIRWFGGGVYGVRVFELEPGRLDVSRIHTPADYWRMLDIDRRSEMEVARRRRIGEIVRDGLGDGVAGGGA